MYITVSNSALLICAFLIVGYKAYIQVADCIHLRKELKIHDEEIISTQVPKIKYHLRKAQKRAIIYTSVTLLFGAVTYVINFY